MKSKILTFDAGEISKKHQNTLIGVFSDGKLIRIRLIEADWIHLLKNDETWYKAYILWLLIGDLQAWEAIPR